MIVVGVMSVVVVVMSMVLVVVKLVGGNVGDRGDYGGGLVFVVGVMVVTGWWWLSWC